MELSRIAERIARATDPSDAQFRVLVSSLTDHAVYLLDPAGCVASWNAGAERIKGYRAAEVLGRNFSLFYPPQERAAGAPERALAAAARDGRFLGEGWRVRKDGSRFWAEVVITALRDTDGTLKGYAKVTRDMTARHAEREREQLLAATFNHAPHGIAIVDRDGRYVGANASFVALLGYTEAELRDKTVFDLTHPEDLSESRALLQEALRGGTARPEFEKRYLRKDGEVIWAHLSVARIVDRDGAATRFVVQVEDVTRRRAAEEEMRRAQALLGAFTDNSPAAMSLKDRDGRYRFANRRFLSRYALSREQVLGRCDEELFPRRHAAGMSAHDVEVMARGEPVQYEETTELGGTTQVSLVVKFPVAGGVGMIAGDITDRRLTEQALREQRALLAEAQKLAGLGWWEWSPETGRVLWSDELYRIHGLSRDTFEPSFEAHLERVHPDDREHSGAMMSRALMEGRGFSTDERIVRPGGEVRYLRSQVEVVRNDQGKPIKILGASLDFTEQRHSETALRQAAQDLHGLTRRLVQAEEAERKRIARELHDRVGQALSALNINLDIVLRSDALAPAARQRLADSANLVESTLHSMEGVMAELRPPLLDEYGLGAALAWHAEEFARRTGIKVSVDDEAAEAVRSLRLEAALALYRIAQEALNNVLKHARAAAVRIEVTLDGNDVVLSVQDDGAGFDFAHVPRGRLGMTTMRERAEAAGGRVQVDSAPGRGTRVVATVPI
jgi:PAS domain S-box-containing protein